MDGITTIRMRGLREGSVIYMSALVVRYRPRRIPSRQDTMDYNGAPTSLSAHAGERIHF